MVTYFGTLRVSITGVCWDIACVHHGCLLGHTCILHRCLLGLTGSWVYCMHVRSSLVHTSSSILHTVRWVLTVLVPLRVVPGATSRDLRLLVASPAIVPRLVTSPILYIIRLVLSPNYPHIYPVNFHNTIPRKDKFAIER